MEQQTVRKTYKEKLRPTPAQERALEDVLWRCRELYNAALEQRITAWQRRRVSVSRYEQEAELKDIRAEFPEYAAIHSHVLQDVLARLDKTYQAFFRRVQRGREGGLPPLQGQESLSTPSPTRSMATARGWTTASWSSPRSGASASIGRDRMEGTPKTVTVSKEADGWYVAISCADVPVHPLPPTGRRRASTWAWSPSPRWPMGSAIFTPAYYRKAEAYLRRCQRRVARRKKGSHRTTQSGGLLGQSAPAHRQPAARLPPQGSAQAGASVRCDLS